MSNIQQEYHDLTGRNYNFYTEKCMETAALQTLNEGGSLGNNREYFKMDDVRISIDNNIHYQLYPKNVLEKDENSIVEIKTSIKLSTSFFPVSELMVLINSSRCCTIPFWNFFISFCR